MTFRFHQEITRCFRGLSRVWFFRDVSACWCEAHSWAASQGQTCRDDARASTLAPGRNLHADQWGDAIPLARCRSEGEVLESVVTKTRDHKAALKFLMKSMKLHGRPEMIVTDRLRSNGAALKDLGCGDDREMGRWLDNRAENSHLPVRRRERAMLRILRMRTLQNFASVHAFVDNCFSVEAPSPGSQHRQRDPRRCSGRVAGPSRRMTDR